MRLQDPVHPSQHVHNDLLKEGLSVSYSNNLPSSNHSLVPMSSLPVRRLREIVCNIISSDTLLSVTKITLDESVDRALPQRYLLTLASGVRLDCVKAPDARVRLLRLERGFLGVAAGVISFLKDAILPRPNFLGTVMNDLQDGSALLRGSLPTVYRYNSSPCELNSPYMIMSHSRGQPLSSLSATLSGLEKQQVEAQLHSLAMTLSSMRSPSHMFGPVIKICPPCDTDFLRPASPEVNEIFATWSQAFAFLFESVLRDGEDISVLLPYLVIRQHLSRLSYCLDVVRVPRLCMLNITDEANILVEKCTESAVSKAGVSNNDYGYQITGLRDWNPAFFGDPLICGLDLYPDNAESCGDDATKKRTRIALYKCYRAIVAIVTEYYRPQIDSSKRELEGRKVLMEVLGELESS